MPVSSLSLQLLGIFGIEAQVFVELHSCLFEKTIVALLLRRQYLLDAFQRLFQAVEHLKLPSHASRALFNLKFFLGQQLSLLIDAVLDSLKCNLSLHTQCIALEDIFAPLNTILLNIG